MAFQFYEIIRLEMSGLSVQCSVKTHVLRVFLGARTCEIFLCFGAIVSLLYFYF